MDSKAEKRGVIQERFRVALKNRGLTQQELADISEASVRTLSRISSDGFISAATAEKIAPFLGVSDAFLRAKSDDPAPPPSDISIPVNLVSRSTADAEVTARLDTNKKIDIPVISMRTPACAGDGNGLDCLELEAEDVYMIDRDAFGILDEFHKPFGVFVDGDSMEEQGILDGEIAIVNPAEEVREGDIALISYKGQWSIKGVEFLPDRSIRLRAGKPQYERVVPADMVEDRYWFRIIGKVVFSQPPRKRPKRFV